MKVMGKGTRKGRLARISIVAAVPLVAGGAYAASVAAPALAANAAPAPAASAAASQPLLQEGSRGSAVQDWQAMLNKLAAKGMPSQAQIAQDGIFGPKTKAATQAFQRWAPMTDDGIAGPQTYTAAARALG
jgi:peptidoglycan hydrolase-like protein with peptidoglycan-binding domain